ncbi:MAG: hypothetical protein CML69_06020 [Rhodobacteraceae bacterium]|nr:hypothetical protein [Paracoccaceae bacterium]
MTHLDARDFLSSRPDNAATIIVDNFDKHSGGPSRSRAENHRKRQKSTDKKAWDTRQKSAQAAVRKFNHRRIFPRNP